MECKADQCDYVAPRYEFVTRVLFFTNIIKVILKVTNIDTLHPSLSPVSCVEARRLKIKHMIIA